MIENNYIVYGIGTRAPYRTILCEHWAIPRKPEIIM